MDVSAEFLSLVADIGGTNTRVAFARGRRVLPGSVRRYANVEHSGLGSVLRRFVAEEGGMTPLAACVAVAGPVRDGVAHMTNLDWTIDAATLAQASGAEVVAILNDLQAQGHALGHLDPVNLRGVIPFPDAGPHAAKLVIGVGTGFNAAPVFDTEVGRLVTPSESGHVTLPVRDAADLRLSEWVSAAHGFPAVEEVLSGRGLETVYAWICHEDGDSGTAVASDIMAAVATGAPRAVRAARTFARMLGSVAGNLALIQLPFGGIWLAGGVARAFAPYLTEFGFVEAFRDKGRFSDFMTSFGVGVIEDDYAALTGSASHLVGLVRRGKLPA